MLKKEKLITNIVQIYSLIIKDLKLKSRYKAELILEFFLPFLALFFPFLIFNTLFSLDVDVFKGYYSKDNFILFLLLGYSVHSCIFLLWHYKDLFYDEKTWKTLHGLFTAPVNKFNVLFGYYVSSLITKSFALVIIVIICYIQFPIPLINLFLALVLLFCISITFASMGFILGLLEIVNENISASLSAGIGFIAIVSCLFYPIEIFPEFIHFIILSNPLYYYFDLLRLTWWAGINKDALQYITIVHILVVIIFTITTPIFASILFYKILSKYGIRGY